MNQQDAITHLETTATSIATLVSDMSDKQARWKPAPESWSALEVLNHLHDEEREDFRLRLDLTLHTPERELPPIDPAGWVTTRAYNTRDLRETVERFLGERRHSLDWLRTVQDSDWNQTCNHPLLGELRAGDLLVSWVAHDLLHLRQLIELRWQYLSTESGPFGFDYAGAW